MTEFAAARLSVPGACLILEAIPLVARDLALTVQEQLGLIPAIAADAAEALDWLAANAAGPSVRLAFVHQNVAEFSDSRLHHALRARAAQIVLMGADGAVDEGVGGDSGDGPEGKPWHVLGVPFTTDHVLSLLCRLGWRAAP